MQAHESDEDLPPLEEEIRKEIARRFAEYEANPSIAVPWEEVEAANLARLKKRPHCE